MDRQDSDTRTRNGESPQRTPDSLLTLPNLLSLTRIALIVPFVIVVFSPIPSARLWAGLIMALAALTDKLDGYVARKYQQATKWGSILDPLADKIGVGALVIVLLVLGLIPVWFAVSLFARDLLILLGSLYLKARYGIVLRSNNAGKWTVGVIAATLFLMLTGVGSVLIDLLIWATVTMLLISLGLYVKQFINVIGRGGRAPNGSS